MEGLRPGLRWWQTDAPDGAEMVDVAGRGAACRINALRRRPAAGLMVVPRDPLRPLDRWTGERPVFSGETVPASAVVCLYHDRVSGDLEHLVRRSLRSGVICLRLVNLGARSGIYATIPVGGAGLRCTPKPWIA